MQRLSESVVYVQKKVYDIAVIKRQRKTILLNFMKYCLKKWLIIIQIIKIEILVAQWCANVTTKCIALISKIFLVSFSKVTFIFWNNDASLLLCSIDPKYNYHMKELSQSLDLLTKNQLYKTWLKWLLLHTTVLIQLQKLIAGSTSKDTK